MLLLTACQPEPTPLPVVTAAPTATATPLPVSADASRGPVMYVSGLAESLLGQRLLALYPDADIIPATDYDSPIARSPQADVVFGREIVPADGASVTVPIVLPVALLLDRTQPPLTDANVFDLSGRFLRDAAVGSLSARDSRIALANVGYPDGIALAGAPAAVDQAALLASAGWVLTFDNRNLTPAVQVLYAPEAIQAAREASPDGLIEGFSLTLSVWVNPASVKVDAAGLIAALSAP
ncbi:MAG: hypothetical protein KME04_03870 [Pleurocapsa minor GSE-CHR-MK-17-07R]|jgi:hypothetical protein|nr:hypothetical protein [Pleurocapsa minor GSE-CHR-MK 17-07R]